MRTSQFRRGSAFFVRRLPLLEIFEREFAGGDLTSELGQANSFVPIRLSDFSLRRFESLR